MARTPLRPYSSATRTKPQRAAAKAAMKLFQKKQREPSPELDDDDSEPIPSLDEVRDMVEIEEFRLKKGTEEEDFKLGDW